NFLVLDEPTNDLDLQTLRTLEEFLLDYPGCILIVSHDRYFMDRMVDHLFAFEGDGVIRDYPGNYTQYREAVSKGTLQDNEQQIMKELPEEGKKTVGSSQLAEGNKQVAEPAKKLSFKEKFELETLEKEMPALQQEKKILEEKMGGNLAYDELQKAADRISNIIASLDEKEMRWLELSERVG
ncbi:MAG: ABC transporter ATP-binding protein, partial [Gloeobacteraceae cyanobacterium ES-bin-316]|nr:ABC transporter ATP-binding protein [Ferruginibacter sp.]